MEAPAEQPFDTSIQHQRPKQDKSASAAVGHGSSNRNDATATPGCQNKPLPKGKPLPNDKPLAPGHQDLLGLGAWANDTQPPPQHHESFLLDITSMK